MKKKAKKSVIPRQQAKAKPAKVGGVSNGGVNWSRIGRRRNHDTDAVQELASALKAVREARGESLTKVATKLDVAPSTLIKFEEKGSPISVKIVLALARYLDCSLKVEEQSKSKAKSGRTTSDD